MLTRWKHPLLDDWNDMLDLIAPRSNVTYERFAWECQENDAGLSVTFEVPGVKTDTLVISAEENTLTVAGEDRHGKKFERVVKINKDYDCSTAKATLESGILEVAIEKANKSSAIKVPITVK